MDSFLFQNMKEEDWNELFELSSCQGINAIALMGVEKGHLRPEIEVLYNWIGAVAYNKTYYDNHVKAVKSLSRQIKVAQAEMMILKGISLSMYYPDPAAREFGDIDIYTYGADGIVNRVIESKGIKINKGPVHDEFDFENEHIEHHKLFVSNYSRLSKKVNEYLLSLTKDNKGTLHDGVYYPCPDFNVIFLLRHTMKHFTGEGVTLRQILDWGLFLDKEGKSVNWNSVRPFLIETKMDTAFNVITRIAEIVYGLKFDSYYISDPNESLTNKVLDEIVITTLHAELGYSMPVRAFKKAKRVLARRWLYTSGIIPDRFWRDFMWWTIKGHIFNPKQI